MKREISTPSVITDTSYFVRITPFVDKINGKNVKIDYGVTADEFSEELHYVIDGIRYIYEVHAVDHLFYKDKTMKTFGSVIQTEENKKLFNELFKIFEKQNKKHGKWIGEYANAWMRALKNPNNLTLKFQYGNWRIMQGTTFLVGYSRKEDANETLRGLNMSDDFNKEVAELKTLEGYNKFLN